MEKFIVSDDKNNILGVADTKEDAEKCIVYHVTSWLTFPRAMGCKRSSCEVVEDTEFVSELMLLAINKEFSEFVEVWNEYVSTQEFHDLELMVVEGQEAETPNVEVLVQDAKRLYTHLNNIGEGSISSKS